MPSIQHPASPTIVKTEMQTSNSLDDLLPPTPSAPAPDPLPPSPPPASMVDVSAATASVSDAPPSAPSPTAQEPLHEQQQQQQQQPALPQQQLQQQPAAALSLPFFGADSIMRAAEAVTAFQSGVPIDPAIIAAARIQLANLAESSTFASQVAAGGFVASQPFSSPLPAAGSIKSPASESSGSTPTTPPSYPTTPNSSRKHRARIDPETGLVIKREQVKHACVHCKKACKKCDDQRPCSRCVKLGYDATCVDSERKVRKKGVPRGPYKPKAPSSTRATPESDPDVHFTSPHASDAHSAPRSQHTETSDSLLLSHRILQDNPGFLHHQLGREHQDGASLPFPSSAASAIHPQYLQAYQYATDVRDVRNFRGPQSASVGSHGGHLHGASSAASAMSSPLADDTIQKANSANSSGNAVSVGKINPLDILAIVADGVCWVNQ